MKKKLISIITALIICLTGFAIVSPETGFASDNKGFVIEDYHMEAQVHENNTMDISETIKVNFSERKHGIYRNIPERVYINATDNEDVSRTYTYACSVENIDVNKEWSFGDDDSNQTILVIGDPDKKVKGRETYKISYEYRYPDDRIDDYDFIYHNVLGEQWPVPIKHFSYEIRFDKPLPKDAVDNFRVYSGSRGSGENDLDATLNASKNKVTGEAYNIGEFQAITVLSELPEGYFTGERKTTPIPSIVGLAIGLAGLVLILISVLRTRRKKAVTTVEFNPPDGMSPAEVGTIIDECADDKDLLSLIPWFADRGYLKVKILEKERKLRKAKEIIELTRIRDLPDDAAQYQKSFFDLLFKEGDVREMDALDEEFGKGFLEAKSQLQQEFSGEKELSTGSSRAFIYSLVIFLGAGMFYAFSSNVDLMDNILPGIGAVVFTVVSFLATSAGRSGAFKIGKGIIALILFAVEFGMIRIFCSDYECMFPAGLTNILFLVFAAGSVLTYFMIAPTEYKLSMLGKLRGLQEFIKVAEMDRLNALVDENPNYFFDILPFAMAFGLSAKWAKHFEDIRIDLPDWYDGGQSADAYGTGMLSAMAFSNILSDGISTPINSAVSSASSGGGGGSAGGGGGGGGGGSW